MTPTKRHGPHGEAPGPLIGNRIEQFAGLPAGTEVHRPTTTKVGVQPEEPALSRLARMQAQQVSHHDLQETDALRIGLVDSLTDLPPLDLRGIRSKQLGGATRRAGALLHRRHEPTLAPVIVVGDPSGRRRIGQRAVPILSGVRETRLLPMGSATEYIHMVAKRIGQAQRFEFTQPHASAGFNYATPQDLTAGGRCGQRLG